MGNITKELQRYGFREIIHWSGRKASAKKKSIPAKVEMVLVFHDFVNHGLMDVIREQARRRRLPIVFSRRGIADLKRVMTEERPSGYAFRQSGPGGTPA